MPVIKGLGWTFDTVADTYEKFRPGYPAALYQTLFDYAATAAGKQAIEVGIGGGQATLPVLEAGWNVTAVEPGANFCTRCREKFAAYPGFTAVEGKFEDVALPANSADLIYAASSFHWVPEEAGYSKAHEVLRPGGVFARFANHPFRNKDNPAMAEAVQRAYEQFYYPFHQRKPEVPVEYTEQEAAARAEIAAKYGFTDLRYAMFTRTRSFSAEEYVMLLGTYSDHIVIEEETRRKFFDAVADAINRHGGTMTICDTLDLQLARKA